MDNERIVVIGPETADTAGLQIALSADHRILGRVDSPEEIAKLPREKADRPTLAIVPIYPRTRRQLTLERVVTFQREFPDAPIIAMTWQEESFPWAKTTFDSGIKIVDLKALVKSL